MNIPAAGVELESVLSLPAGARGAVIFAHGAGSDRKSPRNLLAAERLNEAGVGTLLFDLLTPEEKEQYRDNVFDIGKLTERLVAVTAWLGRQPESKGMKLGYLGASTGAAAALNAAAQLGEKIAVLVSRGGRPDLAEQDRIARVTAPTLFIIGAEDKEVLEASKPPFDRLACEKRLTLVPGATHVFEEPGTLEEATRHAVDWILEHLH